MTIEPARTLPLRPSTHTISEHVTRTFALALPVMGEIFPDVSRWLRTKQCALVTTDGEIPYQLEIQKLQQHVAAMRSLLERRNP